MQKKIKCLLVIALIAAPIVSRATDPAPPTFTNTSADPAKPVTTTRATTSQAPSAAESAAASKTLQNLDRLIRELTSSLSKTEQCFALEASLKSDHAKKKAQLTAEYNGKIPAAFTDLLWQKSERIARQHKVCFQQYEALGAQFTAMNTSFGTIEPKSLNIKRHRASVEQAKQTYLQMVPTTKPYNKAPKPKAEEN